MWQLILLSALILSSNCHARERQSQDDLTPEERKYGAEQNLSPEELIKLLNDADAKQGRSDTLRCGERVRFVASPEEPHSYYNEFGWLVNVNFKNQNQNRCDGALIHLQVVLTAAHCVVGEDPAAIEVIAGRSDPYREYEFEERQDVSQIIIHKDFDGENRRHNFGILILEKPIPSVRNVDVVCLLGVNPFFMEENYVPGRWRMYGGEQTVRAELHMINNTECGEKLDQVGRSRSPLEGNIQCGEPVPRDFDCQATFGNPLVQALYPYSQHYYLIGLMSSHPYCLTSSGPTVWSILTEEDRAWIEETLQSNGIAF